MFAAFHVAGTVLQVALILDTNNKDGIIELPANFISFAATQSGPKALSTLNLAKQYPQTLNLCLYHKPRRWKHERYFESNWISAIRWPVFRQ